MSTLLQINSSISGAAGQSSQLAERFVDQWQVNHPDGVVLRRDLAAAPVPHLDAARFEAFITPAEARTAEQRDVVAYSDALIDELRQADVVVLGLPLYNFGVPSALKAYFDHIARAGVSFRYTENGPEGLLGDRPLYVFAARGGRYAGTAADVQTGFVRQFFGFLGIRDLRFTYVEGLAMGPAVRDEALATAEREIARLVDVIAA